MRSAFKIPAKYELIVQMAKRQKYSVKEADALPRPRNYPSSIADHGGSGEPQCSYMYGGLADLRREGYSCKSPLKMTLKKESAKKERQVLNSSRDS